MKIMVETLYKVYGAAEVELPEGKTRDDIKHIHMNWGKGSIEFKDGTSLDDYFEDELHKNMDEDRYYVYEFCRRPNQISFGEMKE